MINTRSWIGIFALLLSFPTFAADIKISDAWIRATTQNNEDGMVGLTVTSPKKARIIAASSPAYTVTEMRKSGKKKMESLKSITLSANKLYVFGPDSFHLALLGNKHMHEAGDKVAVTITVQYENKKTKDITFLAQPVRIRAGRSPLPMAQILPIVSTKASTMPLPIIEPAAIPEPTEMVAPVAEILPTPEVALPEPVVIAAPISVPATASEPTPEIILTEQTEEEVIPPVEDCAKYSKAINACNQAGDIEDIMRCRKTTDSKLSCNQ